MLQAGKLRHLITLKNPPSESEENLNGLGEQTGDPTTLASDRWANVEAAGGSERVDANQTSAIASHKITLRWLEGVTPATFIEWEGKTLQVLSVANPDGRKFVMEIQAGEKVADYG